MIVDLTKPEMDLITQLMDFGVKAVGMQAVRPELYSVLQKFSVAIQEANKPKEGAEVNG